MSLPASEGETAFLTNQDVFWPCTALHQRFSLLSCAPKTCIVLNSIVALNCAEFHKLRWLVLSWVAQSWVELLLVALSCVELRWVAFGCIDIKVAIQSDCCDIGLSENKCWIFFHCNVKNSSQSLQEESSLTIIAFLAGGFQNVAFNVV